MPGQRGRARRLQWATDAILEGKERPIVRDGEVWYAIPSADKERCEKAFAAWKSMGYRTCVLVDHGAARPTNADLVIEAEGAYEGYFTSVNMLSKMLVAEHGARIVVTGGDDMFPDPKKPALEIASEFFVRFPDGLGVMQPVGDTMTGSMRYCGSPWLGAAWVMRGYGGTGPFWPGYFQFWGDKELFSVGRRLGILWQRPDLTQFHDHYSRRRGPHPDITAYQLNNSALYSRVDLMTRLSRETDGWPGHEPAGGH